MQTVFIEIKMSRALLSQLNIRKQKVYEVRIGYCTFVPSCNMFHQGYDLLSGCLCECVWAQFEMKWTVLETHLSVPWISSTPLP